MKSRKAFVLMLVLTVLVVVIMMTGALMSLHHMDLRSGDYYRDRVLAFQIARGGLNHAAQVLTLDPGETSDISWGDSDRGYEITFSGPPEESSVNNMLGTSRARNFRGNRVLPNTADLLVTAWKGRSRVKVRGVIQRGFALSAGVAATDKIVLSGDVTLNGIASLADPVPRGGGIVSTYSSQDAGDHAVEWDGNGSFTMLGQSRVASGPEADSSYDSVSSNVKNLYPDRIDEGAANQPPPAFSVAQAVDSGSSHPQPDGLTAVTDGYRLNYGQVGDERYVDNNLTVHGDLNLTGGTLFVRGDLTLSGGIHGSGSIFVEGDITVNGGNSVLLSNQSSGAALFAGGEVELTGIDAAGYLDSMASSYPEVATARDELQQALGNFYNAAAAHPDGHSATTLWATTQQMSWDQHDQSNYFVNPIPGPDGRHAVASRHRPVPKTILAIKDSLGTAYTTDTKAQKIVRALEQTHYNFRFNYTAAAEGSSVNEDTYMVDGVDPSTFYSTTSLGWDDDVLLSQLPQNPLAFWDLETARANRRSFQDLTIDHQYRASGGELQNQMHEPHTHHLRRLRQWMFEQARAFAQHHPLDFGWLGSSYFQGLVYAENGVRVDNNFQVVGALISQGEVHLSGGSSLTYNDEYSLYEGSVGPVHIAVYEEL